MALSGRIAYTKAMCAVNVPLVMASATGKGMLKKMAFNFQITGASSTGVFTLKIDGVTIFQESFYNLDDFLNAFVGYITPGAQGTITTAQSNIATINLRETTAGGARLLAGTIVLDLPFQQSFEISIVQNYNDTTPVKMVNAFYMLEV